MWKNKSIRQDHFKKGLIKSCGCLKHQTNKKEIFNNEYEIKNDIVVIKVSNSNNVFIIDLEDLEKIINYTWHESKKGYITSKINNKLTRLHRLIMNVTDRDIQVDHIDRDKLNNRKGNLRLCFNKDNARNKTEPINNKSGFRGVFYSKEKNKWQVKIGNKFIGYYENYYDAVSKRKEVELEQYGIFSPLFDNKNTLKEI
ncbi:HNH endonuclease [Clostridium sp.]|uniref:HNH endonuclease n=1 Tax=Clostridium sp. TaxID=1506 RepID=UPI003216A6E8